MSDSDYIAGQFDRLAGSTELKVKVTGDVAGEQTNWLNASPQVIALLRAGLTGELSAALAALRSAVDKWGISPATDEMGMADAGNATLTETDSTVRAVTMTVGEARELIDADGFGPNAEVTGDVACGQFRDGLSDAFSGGELVEDESVELYVNDIAVP